MFGKSKVVVKLGPLPALSKADQMGPKPADIPAGPTNTYLVLLRHGIGPVEVRAHSHTFGHYTSLDCDGRPKKYPGGDWTHFQVDQATTWIESSKVVDRPGPRDIRPPGLMTVHCWAKYTPSVSVFSIRTADVVMVLEKEACGEPPTIES